MAAFVANDASGTQGCLRLRHNLRHNNEFGFDYLRDNMAWSTVVQRSYVLAVVDEVDSILIDEARTPLIISGPSDQSPKWYADRQARHQIKREDDYEVDEKK